MVVVMVARTNFRESPQWETCIIVALLVISGSTHCAGDIISAVNGHSVDLENINLVLGGLSDEVYTSTLASFPDPTWFGLCVSRAWEWDYQSEFWLGL